MKFTKLFKAALISTGISVGALSVAIPTIFSNHHCQSLQASTAVEECINVVQQNWYSWFQGKSRSTQFHYVDLLELLSRISPTQKP